MTVKSKFIIATGLFAIGAVLIIYVFLMKTSFELLIPGFILVAFAGPAYYFYRYEIQSNLQHKTDDEILKQAEIESKLLGKENAKK